MIMTIDGFYDTGLWQPCVSGYIGILHLGVLALGNWTVLAKLIYKSFKRDTMYATTPTIPDHALPDF
jgi:hypothetical protein